MKSQYLSKRKLPDEPGVYIFKKTTSKGSGEILYIGKATSLKSRVRSYFAKDLLKTRSMLIADMVVLADTIDFEKTDSVLEALILEAELIKKYQPKYNTKEKDNKSFNFVVITDETYPEILTIRGRDLEDKKIRKEFKVKHQFGPFVNGASLREALKIIRRIFPYRDSTCVPLSGIPCFNYQIGLCPGVCVGAVTKAEYAKTIRHISTFFKGKKLELLKQLKKEMKEYAAKLQFEQAEKIKRQIFSLEHIKDSSLIREDLQDESFSSGKLKSVEGDAQGDFQGVFRIEAYDVAHMKGESMTGVMVVIENGMVKKADYRMFKIRRKGINDVASLEEILNRRLNHPEWAMPNLIVVDGGIAQLNVAKKVLAERQFDIALAAVTKNEKHKPKMITGSVLGGEAELKKRSKEILLANSEAHRFTLKYHRNLRSRNMFEGN